MLRKFFEIRSFLCYKIGFNLLHTHALIFNHFICVNIYLYENYTQFSRCCQEKLAKFMFKLKPQKTLLIPFRSQKFLLGTRKDTVAWSCSVKDSFFEISQNSLKNTCPRSFFICVPVN